MTQRGTLLLNSALALSGINDLGREFAPYLLQSFAQRYKGREHSKKNRSFKEGTMKGPPRAAISGQTR